MGGGVGVLVLLTFRGVFFLGVVQNRESLDFRSPEAGRYALRLFKTPQAVLVFTCTRDKENVNS